MVYSKFETPLGQAGLWIVTVEKRRKLVLNVNGGLNKLGNY